MEWLNQAGGIAHTSAARTAGFTDQDMRVAIARDNVRRLRRSWLITPTARAEGVRAVAAGGRVTCLSEAARIGLWVPKHDEFHVSMPPSSSAPRVPGTRHHWSPGPVPVARRAWHEPLINVLDHVARCLPRADVLGSVGVGVDPDRAPLPEHLSRVQWS